jgi:hypothetical protein
MNAQKRRETAIRAARAQLRSNGQPITLDNAERTLDDMARTRPQLVAAQWWQTASDNQVKLFRREWRQWTLSQ